MVDSPTTWRRPQSEYLLPKGEVHVWRASLRQSAENIAKIRSTLSPQEHDRASRFRFEQDRSRFVIGRGISRILIGSCLGLAAHSLRFKFGSEGKPALLIEPEDTLLDFNVTHSGDLVLIALAHGRKVGIDIEQIRTDFDPDVIAQQYFSRSERTRLLNLPKHLKHEAFFSCWTKKEAFLKARGHGVGRGLDILDAALLTEQETRDFRSHDGSSEACGWTLRLLDLGDCYKAALVVEGRDPVTLETWDWPGSGLRNLP